MTLATDTYVKPIKLTINTYGKPNNIGIQPH